MTGNSRFSDKVAIVTGAASGIGREIALRLAREGARVVVADRNAEGAATTVAEITAAGAGALAHTADLKLAADAERLVDTTLSTFGKLEILVNCAGIAAQMPILETSEDLWRNVMDVNLTSCFFASKLAAAEMQKNGGGRIVNITSHAGLLGSTGRGAYASSKGGMIALTRVMAVELAACGITVNAVAPGPIESEMTARHPKERRAGWMNAVPIQRYGTVGEVAAAVLFLASDEAAYITGQTLCVDGGFTAAGLMMRPPWQDA